MANAVHYTWQMHYNIHGNCSTTDMAIAVHFQLDIVISTPTFPNGSTLHKTWQLHFLLNMASTAE